MDNISIPDLTPNRFFKNEGRLNLKNMSFKEYTEFRNGWSSTFKQSFLDKADNIYNVPFLGGVYGFTNENVTITNDPASQKQTSLYFNVITLGTWTASNQYPVTLNVGESEINKILVIKTNYQIDVQILDGTTIVQSLDDQNPIDGLVQIELTNNYVDLFVKVRSDFAGSIDVEIKGIAVVEPPIEYYFCDNQRMSKLIDISQFGAVYLFSSESETTFLPAASAGDEYSDIIRKYEIDLLHSYDDREKLILTFNDGSSPYYFGGSLDGFPVLIEDRIPQVYDFISFYVLMNDPDVGPPVPYKLVVEVAHKELLKVEMTDTNAGNPNIDFPVTYLSQRIDNEFWYQADGQSEVLTNSEEALIEVAGVLRAKKEFDVNQYRAFTESIEVYGQNVANDDFYSIANLETFPAFMSTLDPNIVDDRREVSFGDTNGELIKIKKIAQIRPYTNCAYFEIDGHFSEPFEIITLEEADQRQMLNLKYSHSQDFQDLSFDNFEGSILLPFCLESEDTQEVTIYNGQGENDTRGSENLKIENFEAHQPLPVYLKTMLQMIFNFDDLKIDNISYGIQDPAEAKQFEKSMMYSFIIEVRQDDYQYK